MEQMRCQTTDLVDIRSKVGRFRLLTVFILRARPAKIRRHETQARGLAVELVQGKLKLGGGDQTDENLTPNDGQAAVEFAGEVQQLKFAAELAGGNQRGVGDVDDAIATTSWDDVSQLARKYGPHFGVEERIRVHVRQEVLRQTRVSASFCHAPICKVKRRT